MTRNQGWNWLLLQLAAVLVGIYVGVRLFHWATG
jgi:hypothetical protein